MTIELGISTFGETTPLEKTGKAISHDERIRELLEEITLADKLGIDGYAIGEHHRKDFAVSAPEIVLAMAASKTKRIHLSSATTNLPTIDPIRVYEQYATIDAVAQGRVEIMAGRGSFTEAFDIFGYDLDDYDELFKEKLDLLLRINQGEILNWPGGKFTNKVDHQGIYPRTKNPLPISLATGGSPYSTIRAASLGLPIVYAIIGGEIGHFLPLVKLYRKVAQKSGKDLSTMPIAAHSWGWLDHDNEKAIKDYFYPTKLLVDQISSERPHWNGLTYEQYLQSVSDNGVIFAGDSETVANKIIKMMEILGLSRFYLHLPVGSMPHESVLNAIEIYGKEVVPKVKEYFKDKA
ncbi:putative LLM family oxidoreductase [Lactobacillus colini]|uniref:LLM family oxidoreductase n=1 Tax=Lactobacillus colini TaxID=1819254 RepID=A0ABS4ME26_9LACO|nr:LLM class flavin-dependent oxidoreductase [Lactobacillus colini]MBP2057937.1 putative LLM family oxidoreductase [Lactobacillus colini]